MRVVGVLAGLAGAAVVVVLGAAPVAVVMVAAAGGAPAPVTAATPSAAPTAAGWGARPVRSVLAAAGSQLGVPYVWGGGDAGGATRGAGGAVRGFDCSGLVVYAFARVGIRVPHSSRAQYQAGPRVPLAQARPGDLIFLSRDGTPAGIHHVALVWSATQIIEAQDFGVPVHVRAFAGLSEPQIMPSVVRLLP